DTGLAEPSPAEQGKSVRERLCDEGRGRVELIWEAFEAGLTSDDERVRVGAARCRRLGAERRGRARTRRVFAVCARCPSGRRALTGAAGRGRRAVRGSPALP